jgi:hypothetical protein
MELEGDRFGAQESVSKCFQVQLSGRTTREAWGAFYSPQGNLPVGVSDPDMSGLGARHVRYPSLEPRLGNG